MRQVIVTCDRCAAVEGIEESWWELGFTREVIADELTEVISETWDLCPSCYDVLLPTVLSAVQPIDGV